MPGLIVTVETGVPVTAAEQGCVAQLSYSVCVGPIRSLSISAAYRGVLVAGTPPLHSVAPGGGSNTYRGHFAIPLSGTDRVAVVTIRVTRLQFDGKPAQTLAGPKAQLILDLQPGPVG